MGMSLDREWASPYFFRLAAMQKVKSGGLPAKSHYRDRLPNTFFVTLQREVTKRV